MGENALSLESIPCEGVVLFVFRCLLESLKTKRNYIYTIEKTSAAFKRVNIKTLLS